MSKDPSNPFAQLNARDFPSRNQRGNQPAPKVKGQGGRTVVKDKAAAKAEAEAELDADAEMFMHALGGGFRSLPPKENAPAKAPAKKKAAKTAGQSVQAPAPRAAEPAPFTLEAESGPADADNPFARALKSEGVKRMVQKKAVPAAQPAEAPEAASDDDAPATLAAMARAAARIGRRDDASMLAEAAAEKP